MRNAGGPQLKQLAFAGWSQLLLAGALYGQLASQTPMAKPGVGVRGTESMAIEQCVSGMAFAVLQELVVSPSVSLAVLPETAAGLPRPPRAP